MKKLITSIIGIALFVAVYYQNRRQVEYVTAQATLASPSYTTAPPVAVPFKLKPLFAFRLTKPS